MAGFFRAKRGRGQVEATGFTFAAILQDGSVVSWDTKNSGVDCGPVQHLLRQVQRIEASGLAFAALLADGSVVTWGSRSSGGDSEYVQDRLKKVKQIKASGEELKKMS